MSGNLREKALAVEQLNRLKHCSMRGRDRELLQVHRDGIRKIEHVIEVHRKATSEILAAVQSIKKPQLSEVARKHYIEGKPLDVIAEEMNYSTPRIAHLHAAALDALQLPEGYGKGRA